MIFHVWRNPFQQQASADQAALSKVVGEAMNGVWRWPADKERAREVASVTALSLLAFLNIHHYFTDGVMWKLRNPEVRQDLFGHLPAPVPAVTAPAEARPRRERRRKTG